MNQSKHLLNLKKTLASAAVLLLTASPTVCQSAMQDDSGQQALQQLKLLQQKLAQNTNSNDGSANTAQQGNPVQLQSQTNTNAGTNTVPNNGNPNQQNTPPAAVVKTPTAPSGTSQHQAQIANPVEIAPVSDKELIENNAFDGMTRQLFPLSPERIVELKQIYDTSQFATESPAGTPPKPTATSQFVNLSPGSTPPVIRLAQGFVSSLVFLDTTGAPWPISAYDLGDPTSFNIQWDKTGNTLMIQALKLYNYGNLAVKLKGLNTPVMLTLIPGQKAVDYRVDLRVQGYGPNASSLPLEEGIPPNASDVLLHVLEGVPPQGSQHLTVTGGDARAWLLGDKIYVRTNLTVLSPGWLASMTSADGMHAYEMQKSPVLLVSWHGKVMQLKVEGL